MDNSGEVIVCSKSPSKGRRSAAKSHLCPKQIEGEKKVVHPRGCRSRAHPVSLHVCIFAPLRDALFLASPVLMLSHLL